MVALAHGSDGGGSVRIRASDCGRFGFQPTRARLPDGTCAGEGWAGMAIDGFLTRSVRDTAAILDACIGADAGAPCRAPPLAASHMDAASRPPRRLRVMLLATTFAGKAIDPQVRDKVLAAARLLEDLGHRVAPGLPRADVPAMMRARTDFVAVGTSLSARGALAGRAPEGLIEGVAQGALAHAETLHPTRCLQAVGKIHGFGRRMAAAFDGCDVTLWATLADPPPPASAASPVRPAATPCTTASGPAWSSTIRPSAPSSTPRASPPPRCRWACPSASTLPRPSDGTRT